MRAVPLLVIVCAGACSAEAAPPVFQERDSADLVIAESTAPRWVDGAAWVVDPSPILDLASGGTGPANELYRVRDATRLHDGRIAVANGGTNEVRVFRASGAHERTLGREGAGPGEFTRIESVSAYRGDSLVVFDDELRRITVFGPDGTFGRSSQVTGIDGQLEELYPTGDGGFLIRSYVLQSERLGRYRDPASLSSISPDGSGPTEVARAAGFEHHSFPGSDALPPYARDSHVAVANGLIYLGDAEGMDFRVHALDGRLVRIVRVPGYDLSVPESERDSVRAAMLAREMPPQLRAMQDEMANTLATVRPAYSDLIVDTDGFTWLTEYRASSSLSSTPRGWIVFDPSGEWLGTVALPPNFDLYEVGRDYVLGRRRDELGVETVQMLRLTRR